MQNLLVKNYKPIVFVILAFMAVVSLLNAWNDSAIFDETAHIGAAYSYVSQSEIRLNPEHPPLIKNLAGLPLLFLDLTFDTSQPFWTGELKGKWDEGQWASGRHLLYEAGNDPNAIIFWSRFPIVILSLILGFFLFKWGRELSGTLAGLMALTLYAFDPNILGHNHFVTTDLGIAAFFTFAFYYYFHFIKHPTWKNSGLAGLFLGLLLVTKFSFFVAFPVLGLATLVYPLIKTTSESRALGRIKLLSEYIGKGALIFLLALVVVWITYAANTFNMAPETVSRTIDANFSPANTGNALNMQTNQILHWLNGNSLTRPLAPFGTGVGYVFRRVVGGNGAYFLGQVSSQAFPLYFPVVFGIKEPLPTLFFMLFALVISLGRISQTFLRSFKNFLHLSWQNTVRFSRTHITEFSLFLFVLLYGYISVTGNLNIGFRHLFPILPFIYLLTAKTLANFLKNRIPQRQALASHSHNSPEAVALAKKEEDEKQKIRIFSIVFFLLFGYQIAGTFLAYPNYMSYFNEIVGGPKNGYHYVTDSNADWGQDLKRLSKWIDDHNLSVEKKYCIAVIPAPPECTLIDKIRVDYFGGGDIKTYIGDKYLQWWDSKRPIEPGWYAVSTNFLMGSLYDTTKKDADSYRWLKNKKPAYQVGTSILVYYIAPEEIR